MEAADPEPLDAFVDLEADASGGARHQSATAINSSSITSIASALSQASAKNVLITGANLSSTLPTPDNPALLSAIASSELTLPTQVPIHVQRSSLPGAGATSSVSGHSLTATALAFTEAQHVLPSQRASVSFPMVTSPTAAPASLSPGATGTVTSSGGGGGGLGGVGVGGFGGLGGAGGSEWEREREELERRRVRSEVELLDIRRMHAQADLQRAMLQCELVRAQIAHLEARTRLLEQQHQRSQRNQNQQRGSGSGSGLTSTLRAEHEGPARGDSGDQHQHQRENEREHVDASTSIRQLALPSGSGFDAILQANSIPSPQTISPSASQDSHLSALINGTLSERSPHF